MRAPSFGGIFLALLLAGCGGGGGSNNAGPTPAPRFTISLSTGSVTVLKGGATQTVQVTVAAHNGFSGTVSVTPMGLPSGVTVAPSALSLTSGSSGAFVFGATSTAGIAQQFSTVEGVSGTLKVDTALQITVNGAPVPDPFHKVGGELAHGFYDQSRKLLFAANFGLNEVDVISGTDFSVLSRVNVQQPWSIDQMADGKTLVVGTAAQEIVTVDEDTLAVTRHPVAGIGHPTFGLFYPIVIAMANGKVLMIGQEEGIDSGDILDGGQFLLEWDSVADTFKIVEPTGQLNWETDRLARSADHKWAVFSADQFYLYSSDADSLTTVPLNSVDPPTNTFGVRGYAMNADGSKIAVASAQQVTFLDRTFTVLGSTQIPYAFQGARTSVAFSPDGNRLLLQYSLPAAIEVADTNTFTALGYYSADAAPEDSFARLLGTDSSGHAMVGMNTGFLTIDMNQPPIPNPPSDGSVLAGTRCQGPNSSSEPLNTSTPISILNAAPGTSYYFGGQPAPLLANGTEIEIPASSVAGPVDIECIGPDGNTFVRAFAFSYGVDPIGVSANLLPPTGNPVVLVFGFGFTADPFGTPSVTVGGQPALGAQSLTGIDFGSLQGAAVKVPDKGAGESADITVSSPNGSGNLTQAVTYIPSASIISASGLLQVLYDSHRSVLYALKPTEVDVLDPVTLQWQTPFQLPTSGGSANYNVMALSPDGSRLIAASPNGYAAVLDPDNPSGVSLVTGTGIPGFQSGSLAITKFNKALISGSPNVEVDLITLGVKSISGSFGDLVRTSADGTTLHGVALNVSNGEVFSIDPATYAVQSAGFGFLFWTDLAVSADGSQLAAIDGAPDAAGDIIGFFDSGLRFLNTNEYPLVSPPDDVQVLGSVFSPLGKVLLVALGDSIEFWDAAKGTLRARLMTPEELQVLVFPEGPVAPRLALDSTGQTVFAISKSGLTVMKLAQSADDLASQPWALEARSASKHANLADGIRARVAAMRKTKGK